MDSAAIYAVIVLSSGFSIFMIASGIAAIIKAGQKRQDKFKL